MSDTSFESRIEPFLSRFFRFVVKRRWWVIAFYGILLVPFTYYALRFKSDNSLERLLVQSDPTYQLTKKYQALFGRDEFVVVLIETNDPWRKEVVETAVSFDAKFAQNKIPTSSLFSLYALRGEKPLENIAEFRKVIEGTAIAKEQGLWSNKHWIFQVRLGATAPEKRQSILSTLDDIIRQQEKTLPSSTRIIKVGEPYVNASLDQSTRSASFRYFPLFALFVIVLNLLLYRSGRALLAFMIPLLTTVVFTLGYIGLTGGEFTIVSSLVPMTILIVCTSTLVYLHSRFVDKPEESSAEDHQIFALVNKFLASTASIFAAAVGFAALAVSDIRPVKEMGLWVAIGLLFTWVIVFTLFPALQSLLKTPTQSEKVANNGRYLALIEWLPMFSYRFRYLLVGGALVWCVLGVIAIFGIPKTRLKPMQLQTNAIEYINHSSNLYKDTKSILSMGGGLSVANLWVTPSKNTSATLVEPPALRALNELENRLKSDPEIKSVAGLPSVFRILSYFQARGSDQFPTDSSSDEKLEDRMDLLRFQAADQIKPFLEVKKVQDAGFFIRTSELNHDGFSLLEKRIQQLFANVKTTHPSLAEFQIHLVGLGPLQAEIGHNLIPTLLESLGLTVIIIFVAFLLIFRNGAARVMALIPSVFAILAMFSIMRLCGLELNVATILIASTVLGASENDQIHFFYHYQEKRKSSTTEEALKHTLRVAGKAILFATLINTAGFLAFGIADLPPIREFGLLSALAFVLSMIADFTALPAALWLVFRDKPDALKHEGASIVQTRDVP